MDEDWDDLARTARRLTAERFAPSPRAAEREAGERRARRRKQTPPGAFPEVLHEDTDIEQARRRRILAEAAGDEHDDKVVENG